MDGELIILKDPLNNQVRLPKKFEQVLLLHDCIDKDISLTVLKPAMIILPRDEGDSLYHARLVDWEITVLLRSEWEKGFWLVTECFWDVDSQYLKEIISKGDCVTF
jgi:hypothetical protein